MLHVIFSRLKSLSDEGEIIAGSKEEEKIKNKIRKMLEPVSDEIRVTPIRVLNWREKEIIVECEGKKIDAISFPYSLSTDIEGNVTDNLSECNEKILKVNIANLFEINKHYINAVKANCKAVIFSLDDEKRRFVVKYGNMLNYGPCPPPPIPAIYVKSSDFNKIRGKCRILIESEINPYATGYVIEGIANAKNETDVIHITAHHDHWLAGERDDLLAVSLLPEFKSNQYETHLISYTAEESGSIYFSTFSWSYGSRTFLSNLRSGNLDNILVNINLDNISEYEIIIKTVPGLKDLFSGLHTNVINVPEIYSDSYSYIRNGIPSINIGSENNPHYHGEFDKIDLNDSKMIDNINLIKNIISKIINNTIYYNFNDMIEQVRNSMLYTHPPLRTYLVNLIDRLREKDIYVYRNLLKFYGGILNVEENYANVKLFHKSYGIEEMIKRKATMCIENFQCLEKPKESSSTYYRYFTYYLNGLKESISNEYTDQIYLLLKKFL